MPKQAIAAGMKKIMMRPCASLRENGAHSVSMVNGVTGCPHKEDASDLPIALNKM